MAKKNKSKNRSTQAKATPQAAVDTAALSEAVAAPAKGADKDTKVAAKKAPVAAKKAPVAPKKAQKKPNIIRRFITYISNVRLEVKRTTWPTRNEVLNMTIIVIIALLFFGILIMIVDQIMVVVVRFLSQFKLGVNAGDVGDVVEAANAVSLYSSNLMGGR